MIAGYSVYRANISKPKPKLSLKTIMMEVVNHTHIQHELIASKSRKGIIVRARFYYCYIAWITGGYSLNEISTLVGFRDHTTIMHARDTVMDNLTYEKRTIADISELKSKLNIA